MHIANLLQKNTDTFNYKTFGIEDFKNILKTQKLFKAHGELQFLPPDFHKFIDIYYQMPDHHIKLYDFDHYRWQFLKNLILPELYEIRYILFHRTIYDKVNPIKIQLIYVEDTDSYAVVKNFDFEAELPAVPQLTFDEAFEAFFQN